MCEGAACWVLGVAATTVGLLAFGGWFALFVERGWPWPLEGWRATASGLFVVFWAALLYGVLAAGAAFVGLSLLLGLLGC